MARIFSTPLIWVAQEMISALLPWTPRLMSARRPNLFFGFPNGGDNPVLARSERCFLAKVSVNYSLVDVTLQTTPSGIALFVDGTTNSTPVSFHWPAGSFHTIAALPESAGTNTQYSWVSWSDGGNLLHNVAAAGDTNITANFKLHCIS